MDQNRTITAYFAINSYTLHATAGPGGNIIPAGLVNVNYGGTQAFTITPDMKYQLDSLFVDGINQDSTTSYTFINVTADHTIHTAFKEILNPVPVLTGISPVGGYRGDTLTVLFSGSNISADAVINLGAGITSLQQSLVGENLQAIIVISDYTTPGLRNFSLTNPPPGGGTSDEMIFTIYNHVPTAFYLIEPADGGMIQLTTNPQPITFAWHPSVDPDLGDTLTYILHLPGTPLEDSITVRGDTSVTLDYMDVLTPNTVYFWSLSVTDGHDTVASTEVFSFSTSATILAVDQVVNQIPTEYALYQNYPNPFNPVTKLTYQLPIESRVTVKIYNLLGQIMATIVDEVQTPGYKSVDWDAGNLASGVYLYRLETTSKGDQSKTFTCIKKMFLVR